MGLDKLGLTLYDFLGYLFPGYLLLLCLSIAEASLFRGRLFSLETIFLNLFPYSVGAYFLGHLAHTTGSLLKSWKPRLFTSYAHRLSRPIFLAVRKAAQQAYQVELEQDQKIGTLEAYMLADSYLAVSGESAFRDALIAREGFAKASMVGFLMLTLVLAASAISGGTMIQISQNDVIVVPVGGTLLLAACASVMTVVFWRCFAYFGRVKVNNTLLMFLARYRMDTLSKEDGKPEEASNEQR
jgi:hypothetical protein